MVNQETLDGGRKNNEDAPSWAKYFNHDEVLVSFGNDSILGVLSHVNMKERYAEFLPVMANEADGERVRIERKTPVTVTLSLLEKGDVIYRPYPKGYMEKREEIINKNVDRKSGIGFHHHTPN